jgi:hypothetical protein
MSVNNFDVLKRMAAENLDIRLGTDVVRVKKVKAGTEVTVGIGCDAVGSIAVGDLHVCLILFSKKQFDWVKEKIEEKP